jgi:predicted CopG family antitoxin
MKSIEIDDNAFAPLKKLKTKLKTTFPIHPQ